MSGVVQSYVERPAPLALREVVSTTWVQRVDAGTLTQRDVPSGSVELRCRIGTEPEVIGPLTSARVEVLEPGTTVVGVRLHPEAAARVLSLPAYELVDQAVPVDAVWREPGTLLAEEIAGAVTAELAVGRLLDRVARSLGAAPAKSPVAAAVRRLRRSGDDVSAVARELHVSERHLRRRMLEQVGLSPKTLQRTLRFQRFLALAQHSMATGCAPGVDGLSRLAADAGFADQAHLSRECRRMTGLTPSAFLGSAQELCACGHDHAAAYGPLLRDRDSPRRAT